MLTGDKALTAKMIAIQSGLIKQINSSSTFIQLKESSNLEEIKLEIQRALLITTKDKQFELMVEGSTMAIIIENLSLVREAK